ncbi:DotU family type IV/VI secretion system protein [Francisella philomiragia]|uniref:DotU family type IV/VI secretion system protein n=1 Tax=Francisella philomiragia TaxID=28110 RepID=UPI0035190E37
MHQNIVDIFVTIKSFTESYSTDTQIQDILNFRNQVITKTNNVRDVIYKQHGEKASYYIAFAIYSYCDEMINQLGVYNDNNSNISSWHLLQEEVYQRNDGGDYFFDIVDSVIENPVFPKEVAQVLYLILALNFKGCYLGNESEIDKYKKRLEVILPEQNIDNMKNITFDKSQTKFVGSYKSKLKKVLFMGIIFFPIIAYLGIFLVK